MTYSLEQVHAGLKLLHSNKRYFSTKTLSTQSGLPFELLHTLIELLPTLSLVKPKLTPGGKFFSFSLTYAAKGFVFILPNKVWFDGRLVESSGNSLFDQRTQAYHNRFYKDKAATEGIRYIAILDLKALTTLVFEALYPNHAEDAAKAALEDSLRHLHDYPDALAKVRELMDSEVKQIAKLEHLIRLDRDAIATYEREHRRAESGQRTKQEAYSVIVGEEDVFTGMVLNTGNAWHGTDDHYEPRFERMNKYETRYRTVRDYPNKPGLQQAAIAQLQQELEKIRNQQYTIKKSPVSYQNSINEQRRLEKLHDEYRQKRRELDAHYKRLGLDIETISKKRPVFA